MDKDVMIYQYNLGGIYVNFITKNKIVLIFLLTTISSLLIAFMYSKLSQSFEYCFLLYFISIALFLSLVSNINHLKNIHPEREVMFEIIVSFVSALFIPLTVFIFPFFMDLRPLNEAITGFIVTFFLILLTSHIRYVRSH
jgi:hypothetical protein